MMDSGIYKIPSISELVAFESAARHGKLSLAAGELGISQPAISRHIAQLEKQLSARLFERSRSGVSLTDAGLHFRDAVVTGLEAIHVGAAEAASLSDDTRVVIACPHDTSYLVVFSRYDALRAVLGKEVRIRLLTYHRTPKDLPIDPAADVLLCWNLPGKAPNMKKDDVVMVFGEEVQLICSPDYRATHADTLCRPITDWDGVTFLELNQPNQGWASWSDWFQIAGSPASTPCYEVFDSYIQILESAAAGHGIALGWRNCIERYLDSGALVMLQDGFVRFDHSFVAMLTAKGRKKPVARKCLSFFERWEQNQSLLG